MPFNGLQPWHVIILVVVVVLVFGSKKLPDAARSLGKSMRIFKSEVREMQNDGKPEAPTPAPATPVQSERVETTAIPPTEPSHTDAQTA
jgi:sec-independent protein translocase protein TatA